MNQNRNTALGVLLTGLLALFTSGIAVAAEKLNNRSVQDYIRTAELMRNWQTADSTYGLNMVEGEGLNYTLASLKDLGGIWLADNEQSLAALDLGLLLNQNGYKTLYDFYDAGFAVASAYYVVRFGDKAGEYMQGLQKIDAITQSSNRLFGSFKSKVFGSTSTANAVMGATQWAVSDRNLKAVQQNFELVDGFFSSGTEADHVDTENDQAATSTTTGGGNPI